MESTMEGKILPCREPFYSPECLSPARWICKAHFQEDMLRSYSKSNREFANQPNLSRKNNGEANICIYPGGRVAVPLGFGVHLPSGLAMTTVSIVGDVLQKGMEVITSIADGTEENVLAGEELVAVLINHSAQAVKIREGDAICHLLFHETPHVRWKMEKTEGPRTKLNEA